MASKEMSPQPKTVVFEPAYSPFVALFEQNRVPSFEQRKTIQEMLAEKTAHLAQLKSRVPKRRPGKKHQVPGELRAELAYTRRWLDFHRALVSPWRQLPVEIMSEIFIFTLKCRGATDEVERWDDDRAGTLLLCKICSAWRVIALRTPALWNTLSFCAIALARPPEWVSTWLARSQSVPVFLQLLWDPQTLLDVINSVMSVFESHLHHTAELAINGTYFLDEQVIEDSPILTFNPSIESLNAPLLSAVHVSLAQGSVWDWIHAACRASPCLTHLTTSHSSLDLFPLANLTDFTWIHEAPMSQVIKMFEDAPNLRFLDFNVAGPIVPSSARSRLTMKSITKLKIASYKYLGEFLEQAEFPSLVNLSICFVDTWPGPPPLSLIPLALGMRSNRPRVPRVRHILSGNHNLSSAQRLQNAGIVFLRLFPSECRCTSAASHVPGAFPLLQPQIGDHYPARHLLHRWSSFRHGVVALFHDLAIWSAETSSTD
ncbi:hypothetical protein C8R45DRAFT_975883 [Mycena sanguinolenta]|nr:hypothetical protein C8R45DRAFT_975883 [Mycena sanguinolenta]